MLLAGANDGLGGGNPVTAAANRVTAIDDLKAAGAQNFLVANLPDLSLTPAVYGNAAAQPFSTTFNASLASGLASITGVTIFGLDLYTLVIQTVAHGLLADAALLAIPEPGTGTLVLVGLLVLVVRSRRSAR